MADVAKGTVISWRATTVTGVQSFSGPGITHESLDITDLSDAYKTYLAAGVADPGEVSMDILYEPDTAIHEALRADCASGTTGVFSLTFADAGTSLWTAQGFVTAFEPSASVGAELTASVTIKLSDTLTTT